MSDILTTAQVLRHVADNLDAGRESSYGLQVHDHDGLVNLLCPLAAIRNGTKICLKPRTRALNGFEVPAPMDVMPVAGVKYWTVSATSEDGVDCCIFGNDDIDQRVFSFGLMFATESDAIANFKAICGIDPNAEDES